ncbi:MAG TPA: DNA polymerase [Methylomirabilota bacterium]|jgi:DNA polymerase-1|nr:DNA polymerase [Methylomirabilota bacterium]
MPAKFYLVDGPSYFYRAYHAIGHLSTSRGIPTNATLGMTMMLWKILREERPGYMGVAWDAPGPTFRHQQFEAYKIQRPGMPKDLVDQIPWIRRSLEVLGLPVLEVPGFEADDILATAVAQLGERVELVLVSGDKDTLQLVRPGVTVLSVLGRTGERIVYDEAKVIERWGVPPARIPDVLGLMGDSIDNIPGVPGVGEVTAQKLMRQFGSLEALYENLAVVTGPKLRETLGRYRDQAFFSRQLAVLDAAVPVPIELERFRVRDPDWERLRAFWSELEFTNLLKQLPSRAVTVPSGEVPRVDEAGWREWLTRAGDALAVEPVLIGTPPELRLAGLACYSPSPGACYLPDLPALAERRVVGHDVKALVTWALARGVPLRPDRLEDTAVAAYLLNSGRAGYPLEQLCLEAGGPTVPGPLATLLEGKPPAEADPALLAAWAGARAQAVWRLWECQQPLLERDGLTALYRDLELPLVPVLAGLELAGIRVAPERLAVLAKELEYQLDALLREIHTLAGEAVNPNSPRQLAVVLFEKLKLPPLRRTKTGYSTDVDVLEELALGHPLPQRILEYRQLAKLKGTYADALPGLVHPRTGRIHTSFNQLVAATGRLSCLPAGTLIDTQRGLVGIEDVRPGDLVRTSDRPRPVLAWEATGLKSVVALHLSNGMVLRCSPDHRLLSKGRWVEAGSLGAGDPLYMSFRDGLFGSRVDFEVQRVAAYMTRRSPTLPSEWSAGLAELVGYAMADGHMARSNYNDKAAALILAFDWGEDDLVEYFARIIERLFEKAPTRRATRSCPVLTVAGVDICGLLEQLGAGGSSKTIRVPPSIFSAPEPIVAAFLRGYFEGDGSASSRLSARSVSRKMLEGVHHLLTLFGIPSSIKVGSPDPRGYAPRHTLYVLGDRSKRAFRDRINFISPRKRAQLEQLLVRQSVKSRAELLTVTSSADILSIKTDLYDAHRAPTGKPPQALYVFMHKYAGGRRSTVTLPRIEQIVGALERRGAAIPSSLADAVRGQHFEVRITAIEREAAVPMYEIAVEDSHYIAGGIIVHNSSSPNLQNIPIRNELGRRIRQAFIPEDGWRFLAADYSQIELRIFAHLSGEEALLDAFRRNEDIHTRTAAEILHVAPADVTPEMRRLAKVVNFGILYGISGFGLAQAASIDRRDAQRYIEAYFAAHPKVRAYIDRTVAEGRERGYVTTLLGRRRYLPELTARNPQVRAAAERMASNAPIQGTASDIIKLAMVRLAAVLAERGRRTRMLLQVHDELLFEVPEGEREAARALVPEVMESVMRLDVPLKVDVKEGRDWAEV